MLGSVAEAEAGTLQLFVGGDAACAERLWPLFMSIGNPMRVGGLGSGARAKLVANAALFGVLGALGESLALAQALGLPVDTAFDVLAKTPLGAQAERRRAAIESGEYPQRFALSLARKDTDLIAEAVGRGTHLPVLGAARSWLHAAESAGLGESDYSAVLSLILSGGRG